MSASTAATAGHHRRWPLISVQTDVPTRGPGRSASLLPIEGGRWLVTAAGTRGAEPPRDEVGFLEFLRTIRHPIIADLVAGLEAATPVYTTHATANRRLHFEKLPTWPDGLVVLADALATFNPIYGQGMAVSAQSSLVLRDNIRTCGLGVGSGRRLQKALARTVQAPWASATSIDVFYPHPGGTGPTRADRFGLAYVNRVIRAAVDREDAAAAFMQVVSLSAPASRLAAPRVLLAAARRRLPLPAEALAAVPLTADERAVAGLDGSG